MTPFSTVSPLDGAPLDPVEATAPADVAAIVARAREAQALWAAKSLQDRMEAIFKVKDRILDAGEEIARVLKAECGKPEGESWTAEVLPNADLVEHWVDNIEKELAPEEIELDPLNFPG
ncbi:MAG: aldehyde dehydrogenase family protein [Polyangiales bacterium]